MDKFEEKLDELAQMSIEERNMSLEEIKKLCACPVAQLTTNVQKMRMN